MKKSYGRCIDIKNKYCHDTEKNASLCPRSTSKYHIYETVSYPFGKGKIKVINLLNNAGEKKSEILILVR